MAKDSAAYIGLLGGMGHKATLLAYEMLNTLYQSKVGKEHTCPIRLLSIDFAEINAILPYETAKAAALLEPHLLDLDRQHIACSLMLNNTLHEAFDLLSPKLPLVHPFGHIGELLRDELSRRKPKTVMLLGTHYTMSSPFFPTYLPSEVSLIQPDKKTISTIDALWTSFFMDGDKALLAEVLRVLDAEYSYVDVFIVACTELSIAFEKQAMDRENWIDTMRLQCEYAVRQLHYS